MAGDNRAVTSAPRRISNPPNPWESNHVEWLEDPASVALEVYEEEAQSILASNDSPDISFTWSVNPYRGCQHACAYCYARPGHQYLGLGAGTDFDSKIVVKTNAAELLRHELATKRWSRGREEIMFSGVTDCYQPLEASYEITRRCLEVCDEFRHPIGIITKGALVRRDVDLLARMAQRGGAHVAISIPFLDVDDARKIEPWASSPQTRFETIRRLAEAGVPTSVAVAPLIPGLNDSAMPAILAEAKAAGARAAFTILLRLPAEVRPVFEERLRASYPDRADKVLNALREMRAGQADPAGFGARQRGVGPRYAALEQLFRVNCRRLGLESGCGEEMRPLSMKAQPREQQRSLFEE
jgi:DNA repair photolyase